MDICARTGLAIRLLRDAKGLSQEDLAFQAELDRTYISGIERGRRNPSLLSLARIAAAMHIPLSEIMAKAESLARKPVSGSKPGKS